jgi:hypothetical protein
MVAVLLLIFLPAIALANPVYQSSSNHSSTPSTVGASSMQYQPESYQMTSTSNYKTGTTLNPVKTYSPFSNESPSSDNSLGTIGGETASQEERKDGFITPSDPGEPTPLGDAWSLLIFAAMAAVVITLRRKQTA